MGISCWLFVALVLVAPTTSAATISTGVQTVRTGMTNAVTVQALPNALCALHQDGVSGSSHSIHLTTDDGGFATFSVTPQADGAIGTQVLDCTDANQVTGSYSVGLQAATGAPLLTSPKPKGVLRPALSGDPMAPTQDELHAQGYLSRPDPIQSPVAYSQWLTSVSVPATIVSSKPIAVPNMRFTNNVTSPNWAGYAATANDSRQFTNATGWWYVPYALPAYNDIAEVDAFWTGVGGYGKNGGGMWQGGIQDESFGYYVGKWPVWFQTSTPWVEFISPNDGSECCTMQTFTGTYYNTSPNDEIAFECYFGLQSGASGIVSPSSQYLWYYFHDITQGWLINWSAMYDPDNPNKTNLAAPITQELSDWSRTRGKNLPPATAGITGGSSEWVVERPCFALPCGSSSSYLWLPDFGSSLMWNARAYDTMTESWVNFDAQPNVFQINMVNSTNVLAYSYDYNGEIDFLWHLPQ